MRHERRRFVRQLRAVLRTEPRVVAALLFGSTAAGRDTPASDVDLAVAIDGDHDLTDPHRLRRRLAARLGRQIDLFDLEDIILQPELPAGVLEEARPVVDRAHVWPRLQAARRTLLNRRPDGRRRRSLVSRALPA
jgi:predicted nucleotidyltransferase